MSEEMRNGSQQNGKQINSSAGTIAGVLALVFAVLGFLVFTILFAPLSLIFALVCLVKAISNKNTMGIVLGILSIIIMIFSLSTSPIFLGMFFSMMR